MQVDTFPLALTRFRRIGVGPSKIVGFLNIYFFANKNAIYQINKQMHLILIVL